MKRIQAKVAIALFCVLGSLWVGYRIGVAFAEGIPDRGALQYAGTIDEGGLPVSGFRDLRVQLWSHETSTDVATDLQCVTDAPAHPVNNGRFVVVLDETCTDAVKRNPDLWAELIVAGTAFPRTRLGAVPFAVEAANGVPLGTVIDWWRPTLDTPLPDGWEFCDGTPVQDDRSPLFNHDPVVLKPDLRNRFARGLDVAAEVDIPATGWEAGGSDHADLDAHRHAWSRFQDNVATNVWYSFNELGVELALITYDDGMDTVGAGNNPIGVDDVSGVDQSRLYYTNDSPAVVLATVPSYVGLVKLCRVR
jgi:hypothetical protein